MDQPFFFLGTGVRKYQPLLENLSRGNNFILDTSYDSVRASVVAQIGASLFQKGEFLKGGEKLIPRYLRGSAAETRLKSLKT